jgi:transcriptional regulator with PAS, ATPase and Fis domain
MAAVNSNLLVTGPTGTGKEMFAQSLHNASPRRHHPFVAINCASIPPTLLESELFGYESGAFTGASRGGKKGYFELANGGTLFLDEIGELPLPFQAHLLRALQGKEIMRVGGDKMIPVDVRIVSATHKDLYQSVRDGAFRADLYHRLNVLRLQLPPLSQRREDIPALAETFMRQKAEELKLPPAILADEALASLSAYPWEGNVRELENAMERLLVMKSGETVQPRDLGEFLPDLQPPAASGLAEAPASAETLTDRERQIVVQTFLRLGKNRRATCRQLGISPTTLWRRLKEAGEAG